MQKRLITLWNHCHRRRHRHHHHLLSQSEQHKHRNNNSITTQHLSQLLFRKLGCAASRQLLVKCSS